MSAAEDLSPPPAYLIAQDVVRALAEDIGSGDATAQLLPETGQRRARIVCREPATLAGAPWVEACFKLLDPSAQIQWHVHDGQSVAPDTTICTIEAQSRALVSAERSAINFLQTLSGTATTVAGYVALVAGTKARILDTRKTLPGLRLAQKYAVRCGGGHNHRIGLYDAVMLKENHLAAAGSIANAIAAARASFPSLPVICEVENFDELEAALAARPDRILLDDFDDHTLRKAVELAGGRVPLEVSGGITLERLPAIAQTGVDCISIGSLTKHVRAIDFSMRVDAGFRG
jgi:nicotinate-nucleotide pyrophosphorylase (carboxylating)